MAEQLNYLTFTVFLLSMFTWVIGGIPQGYHVQDPDSSKRGSNGILANHR